MSQPIISGSRPQDRKLVAVRGADPLISFIVLFVITKKALRAIWAGIAWLPYPLFLFETDLPRTAPDFFFFFNSHGIPLNILPHERFERPYEEVKEE